MMQCADCKHVFGPTERWHRVARPSGVKALCTECWMRPRSVFDAINAQIERDRGMSEMGETPAQQAIVRTRRRRKR